MEFKRYSIIEANIDINDNGSIQDSKEHRPYIIVSNDVNNEHSQVLIVMPLTSKIKKKYLPVHCCLKANSKNGLKVYSMVLGEQPRPICKCNVKSMIGIVEDIEERKKIDKVCFNTFFFGMSLDYVKEAIG